MTLPFSDVLQIIGCAFILAGYWLMARTVKWSSVALVLGCAVWTAWSFAITPRAYWMGGLEIVLGGMSARTFWINRRIV